MLLLYDQLTRPSADGRTLEPALAVKWDVSRDGKTYTFHLRPNVRFHDGSPLTAQDVAFCIENCATSKDSNWTRILSALKGMQVLDRLTVRAHLHEAHAPFLADVALFAASIYPKHLFDQLGQKLFDHPIGTGPFKFTSWARGSEVVLSRNPHFWRKGLPYIDTFHNLAVTDPNTRVLQVENGELDIALAIPPSQAKALRKDTSYSVHVDNFLAVSDAPMNVTRPPLNNRAVRQALNYAIDKNAIVKHILFGFGQPWGQVLPNMYGASPSVKPYPYDPAKAKRLLAQAGFSGGFTMRMAVNSAQPTDPETATIMQEQLAQVGIKLDLQILTEAGWIGVLTSSNHDYDSFLSTASSDIVDPDELAVPLMDGTSGAQAGDTLYNNPAVNALVEKASKEGNRQKRLSQYYTAAKLFHDDAPVIFLFTQPSLSLTRAAVHNFRALPTGNYRMEQVWRSK
jgi:peptide/nickel transport system substrate-binding protein